MRIAAGVLLIIVGIMNGFGGIKYGGVGAMGAAGASEMEKTGKTSADMKKAMEQAKKDGNLKVTAGGEDAMDEATAIAQLAVEKGPAIAAFGIFLFVLLGLQIAAAVTLFMQKAQKFIMVVAILGIAAELVGPVMFSPLGSFGFIAILGIVASVLALLAAKGFSSPAAA
ncbi:MAG: hypothetical protein ACI9U2_001198 [Bradymonadia bacterium]|jgi:hypothetical protein